MRSRPDPSDQGPRGPSRVCKELRSAEGALGSAPIAGEEDSVSSDIKERVGCWFAGQPAELPNVETDVFLITSRG